MNVVAKASVVDTTSWEHVSQNGTPDDVMRYLDRANLGRTDLARIAWRMRDRGFFGQVVERLRGRLHYADVLWSYGVFHRDEDVTREYLRHRNGFLASCGRALTSPLVAIDPIERRSYQHVEFQPLFNARAHRFGKKREILNRSLGAQYLALLEVLAYRPRLDAADWLSVTYYMLLQDRIGDALRCFAKVDAAQLPTRVQYDYMRAYLDFFSDDHAIARGIAENYRDYPVPHWRAKFAEVLAHLDEAEGAAPAQTDTDSRTRQQTDLAATEPALELAVEARRVALRYKNLDGVEVSYYDMDVEFLFSTHPFVQQGSGSFAYIKPNRKESRALPAGQSQLVFDLPAEFRNKNVLVEVRGAGITRRQAYYANSLAAQFAENYGQVEVRHKETSKPLAKVYVKVFARGENGGVRSTRTATPTCAGASTTRRCPGRRRRRPGTPCWCSVMRTAP